jgi:KDO2-lipid IV(A) lauroyltransferase
MRKAGPLFKEHRIGRANLAAAFPEKSPAEIERILLGVWDNLGRVAAEFAHIDRLRIKLPDDPGPHDVVWTERNFQHYVDIKAHGKPTLVFAAHLANWEIAALCGPAFGLDSAVLYRRPNIAAISAAVLGMREGCMGTLIPTGLDAPVRLARALESGMHVGMLVDQFLVKGVDVMFFGRPTKVNPLIAQLARQLDCPIYGMRIVRLPDRHTFLEEVTGPIDAPRDAEGKIDVQGTMQVITSVVETWVREHPEQWLWLHRRWR